MNDSNRIRRRRLKKPVRRFLQGFALITGILLLIIIIIKIFSNGTENKPGGGRVDYFRDTNEIHIRYAQAKGIVPIRSAKEFHTGIDRLTRQKKLVKISGSRFYKVDKLTHSYPYLVPDAADLLDLIGERFHSKLDKNGKDVCLFRITSVLRTNESQKNLRGHNFNATPSVTSHLYGTTFDISYKNLVKRNLFGSMKTVHDPAAIRLLSQTIGELRKEKKLVVVTERRETCFHITVR